MLLSSATLLLTATLADDCYESAGRLPPFTLLGADLEAPGVLRQVVDQVAFRRELIIACGDGTAGASSSTALNTVLQLHALRLHHVLFISDSNASCYGLRAALPSLACVWSSRLPTTKPPNAGIAVELYWSYAFYFYDIRKHYLAELTIELGVNVLQTDTDTMWLANPYPTLKRVFGGQQVHTQTPLCSNSILSKRNYGLREQQRSLHS